MCFNASINRTAEMAAFRMILWACCLLVFHKDVLRYFFVCFLVKGGVAMLFGWVFLLFQSSKADQSHLGAFFSVCGNTGGFGWQMY